MRYAKVAATNTIFTPWVPQMISDSHLTLIADLITDHLNDGVSPNKVRNTWSPVLLNDFVIPFRVVSRPSMPEYMR